MKTKNRSSVDQEISLQSWLRPERTHVGANKDFYQFRAQLENVDNLLRSSHLESMALDFALEGAECLSAREKNSRAAFAIKALRIEVLRMLVGNPSYRKLSTIIASSDLMADFCEARRIDGIRGVSKSTMERASKFFTTEQIRWMSQVLLEMGAEKDRCKELGLQEPLESDVCFVDTTCLEANIHFPVDWVLLRDVTRTLLKAVKLIRAAGLCSRMPEDPECFARKMNRLCIEMTHTRRKTDSKSSRKAVLRKMKPLLKTIAQHAQRHRDSLANNFANTCYSEKQAKRIIDRIDAMLAQVPVVIKQAHERIIGERQVPSCDKVISVYEPDAQIIVRGKAGREVEFGNTLLLSESRQGFILDHQFYQEKAPSEPKQLDESLERQQAFDVSAPIIAACTDRGFSSKQSSKELSNKGIYDAVCPKSPDVLRERMKEPEFAQLQRRRASTEARIAIFKQRQNRRLRARGFENRNRAVSWGVLGHNLWIVSCLIEKQKVRERAA